MCPRLPWLFCRPLCLLRQRTKLTLDKLETLAQARGLKVFARINHAAGAQSIGENLRPTELLILGNPKGGTPLLQCNQAYGIDLPLHVLAWEDAAGKSWLSYKDMSKLGYKHADDSCDAALNRLTGALEGLVNEAAKKST
ncbi:MAG: DUF302 domain-containing protein [Sulfuriferula multivorans]|uniref:DUF302 domain-containing protein n=1 Tax=Sulfuriferula multivorans TaxID=1559896 RepID=A0A7C9K0R5_9PROT|nr:DUF302 domain-containing protein [Sulfuriferula multivorans]